MVEIELREDVQAELHQAGFSGHPEELIRLLQYYQHKFGYISEECVQQVANFLNLSESQVFGVVSFYSQFRLTKPGRNTIRVCQGTACHVQGGAQISREVRKKLGVRPGETTPDNEYEYEEVACLGCCAQAAVVEYNGKIYAKMTPARLDEVLNNERDV